MMTQVKGKMRFDPTLPGEELPYGHWHPITQTFNQVVSIFKSMGFEVKEARLVDDEYHNFEALNIPPNHPARDLHDTFHIAKIAGVQKDKTTKNQKLVPITHTSSMQNRIYRLQKPPLATVIAGRCFRPEKLDPTHEHTFYQLEGVYVDKNVSVSNLVGTLKSFILRFYADEIATRGHEPQIKIFPTYFPFVEPGLEFMLKWPESDNWLELIPAGMIHPNVLREGGIDPNDWNGFAWAIGIDRLTMLKFNIPDIRWFHRADLRFIRQF